MSVVGFDLGSKFCVIAVTKRRGIETLQNEVGKRKTTAVVGYQGKQRQIGEDGVGGLSGNFKNSVLYFKRLLGLPASELPREAKFLNYKTEVDKDGGIRIRVNYDDNQISLRPESVTAAMLYKLRLTAEQGLGQRVSDCVIGCPPYWTEARRRALLDAAHTAGLNVLRVISETTAVALQYGILRPLPAAEVRDVVFVDLGHASYNVALVRFTVNNGVPSLQVVAQASDEHLGTRDFDELVTQYCVGEIKDKFQMDVTTNVRAMIKLRKAAEQVKTRLSANTKVPWNVEYIMNDRDVRGEMQREHFEQLCLERFQQRLKAPLKAVLASPQAEKHKISKTSLHSVEVTGGGSRIPVVKQMVASFFGKDISTTCDGDESVARGCALACAMLSPSFKVRDFEVKDATPYAIKVSWGTSNTEPSRKNMDITVEKETKVIAPMNPIPNTKLVRFTNRAAPFDVVAAYGDPSVLPPGTEPRLARIRISGIPTPKDDDNIPPVKLKLKVNIHGVLEVGGAQLIEEKMVEVPDEEAIKKREEEKKKREEEEKKRKEEEKKKQAEAAQPMETDKKEGDQEKEAAPAAEKPEAAAAEESAAAAKMDTTPEEPIPMKKKKRTIKTELPVQFFFSSGLSSEERKEIYELEVQMANTDRVIRETDEARNQLESYFLEMRSAVQFGGELEDYISEPDSKKLVEACRAQEDWLNDEGWDAQKSEYVKRLNELRKQGELPVKRKWEDVNRQAYVESLKKSIIEFQKFSASDDEKYAHIAAEKKSEVKSKADAIDDWLLKTGLKQDKLQKNQNPVLVCADLKAKQKELEDFCWPIVNTKKPEPKKEEKPKEKKGKKEEGKKADKADESESAKTNGDAEDGSQKKKAKKAAGDDKGDKMDTSS